MKLCNGFANDLDVLVMLISIMYIYDIFVQLLLIS